MILISMGNRMIPTAYSPCSSLIVGKHQIKLNCPRGEHVQFKECIAYEKESLLSSGKETCGFNSQVA